MTDQQRKRVAVIYGSRSVEHDVSIITAYQVMAALDPKKYEVLPVYITKQGLWYTNPGLFTGNPQADIPFHYRIGQLGLTESTTALPPDPKVHGLLSPLISGLFSRTKLTEIDVAVPVLHGTHGEDGTVQGVLELADIPYVGSGVLGSAVSMDKIISKAVLREHGLPVIDYCWTTRADWERDSQPFIDEIERKLQYPVFVKPASLGSSIGVGKAANRQDLIEALDVAFVYDQRVMVEQTLIGAIEINCGVIGNADPITSVLEQPVSAGELLSFDDKYMGNAREGMQGATRIVPAPLSDELTATVKQQAIAAFKAMGCRGIARVDFFVYKETGKCIINEINSLPGSFSFYLWTATGMNPFQTMDKLIGLALEAHAQKRKTTFVLNTSLLEAASISFTGAKGAKGAKGGAKMSRSWAAGDDLQKAEGEMKGTKGL